LYRSIESLRLPNTTLLPTRFNVAVTRQDTVSGIVVSIEGSAQVEEAEAIALELRKLLEGEEPVVTLDLSGIAHVDVSFFQQILALSESLAGRGRRLGIRELPEGHVVRMGSELLGIDLERFMPPGSVP
jgi:anti-anti-sigma regulatory factor